MGKRTTRAIGAAAFVAVLAVGYRLRFREKIMTWGATPEEVSADLPGDELLENPDIVSTRAISVRTPAAAIWPWLVQMGPGRGGAYTYDWIENLLGIEIRSVDRILPEFQDLQVGDVLTDSKGNVAMRVEVLTLEQALSLRSPDGSWVWTFVLAENDGMTRLISRNRIRIGGSLGGRLAMLVMEPGSLVMERKMLLGVKMRAERLRSSPSAADSSSTPSSTTGNGTDAGDTGVAPPRPRP